MSKQVLRGLTVPVCAALCLGILSGCGPKQAELEKMAACLKSNDHDRPEYPTGLWVDHSYWIDLERSRKTTVRQTLIDLGASLADGKVVDAAGKELYFYSVRDHHRRDPNPQKTEEDIEELEKQGHHVVRMYPRPYKN